MTRLILASRSAARARMLRDAGLDIEVRPTPLDEEAAKRGFAASCPTPVDMARKLAAAKALEVTAATDEWILGADQTLELDGALLGKPGSIPGLRLQLERLQGRSHCLHAAAAIIRDGSVVWEGCSTVRVTMRALDAEQIERYLTTEGQNVVGCVGGYRIEGPGVQLLQVVEGDYFAVMGLPMLKLLAALRTSGFGL